MDDAASLKVVGILSANFLFSLTVSNYLTAEIGLVKTPVLSLKIWSASYVCAFLILFFFTAQMFSSILPTQTKGYFVIMSLLKWFLGALVFHGVAVLYGAAFFSYVEETFTWSMVMSSLVTLPSLLTETDELILVLQGKSKVINFPSCICGVMLLSILGAWLGAFALPLDWDRDWQVWPIPCAAGAFLGHFSGLSLSIVLLYWKYWQRNKSKFV